MDRLSLALRYERTDTMFSDFIRAICYEMLVFSYLGGLST